MTSTIPSNVPALTPPPGVTTNFVDPYSLSPVFVVTAVLCLLLATFSVVVRLTIALRGSNSRLRIEDFTCVISWVGLIVTCALTVQEINDGLGRHQWNVPQSSITPMIRLFYINRVVYSPTILAAKLTILLQLMRIFAPSKRGLVYWLTQILIWFNACFYTANVLSVIFQCSPVPKAWLASIPGSCVNTNLNLVITGSINVVSDVLILLLPLWSIWHLKLPIRAKLGVSVAFAAGILYVIPTDDFLWRKASLTAASANIAGVARLIYSVLIIRGSDLTYLRLQHGMWTIAEITTAIVCASLPLVPKFVKIFWPKPSPIRSTFKSSVSKTHGKSESTGSLRGGNSVELGAQPGHSGEEKQVVVTSAFVRTDEESGISEDESTEVGDEQGIRKTVRIEQSS